MPSPTFPARQRWFRLRKFLIRSYWITICLSVATTLWGLWYVNERGFSRHWRSMLMGELERRGVHVTIGKLTLNPLRGLVAKEVHLVQAQERNRVLATINEVVLDINYSYLLHRKKGESFINSIDLRDAAVSLPLNVEQSRGERLDISSLNARIVISRGQLEIEQAEADVHGLHITAKGTLRNPAKFQPTSSTEHQEKAPAQQLRDSVQAWDNLKLTGGNPKIEIDFDGDLADPSGFVAQAAMRADNLTIDGTYNIHSARIAVNYADGVVRLDQCAVSDSRGELDASGAFRPDTKHAVLQVRSTLDIPALLHSARLEPALDDFVFDSPPVLEVHGEADLCDPRPGFHGLLAGRLAAERFSVKSVVFNSADTDFSWDGERWFLHNAHIDHRTGTVAFSAMQTPREFRFAVDSRMNPKALKPLLSPEAASVLETLEFQTPPVIHLEGHGPGFSPSTLSATGQVALGPTHYRGVGINSGTINLALQNNVLTCADFEIKRPEGMGRGTAIYDFKTDILRLVNVTSTLIPTEVISTFDHELAEALIPYRFKTRPVLAVSGTVGCARGDFPHNNLRIEVDAADGMDYTFIHRNLSASRIKGTVWVAGDRVKLIGLEAALFGGLVHTDADISILKAKGDYTAEIQTEEIDFPSLTKLYFDYDTSKGKLNGAFKCSGRHDLTREIIGEGKLEVTDGNVFAIPILGPFTGILDSLLPGTGFNVARKGTCTFTMKDGVIKVDDLTIDGRGFSMIGGGKLFVVDDKIDFTIRINAQGPVGSLLSPVSKLFEYTADDSLSKPNWRPKRLPKALFTPHTATTAPSQTPRTEGHGLQ